MNNLSYDVASQINIVLEQSDFDAVSNHHIVVHIESLSNEGLLQGWATDTSHPTGQCFVILRVDGIVVTGFTCEEPRPDILQSGIAGTAWGFHVSLPEMCLDGQEHVLEIYETAGLPLCLAIDAEIGTSCRLSGRTSIKHACEVVHVTGTRGRTLNVACTLMQRDEDTLLETWIRYHGALFGYQSIYIIDNGSTSETTIEILARFEGHGVNVDRQYSRRDDYKLKGKLVTDIVQRLDKNSQYDFYMLLDCDEFVALKTIDGSFTSDASAIMKHLQSFVGSRSLLKVETNLSNLPGTPGLYRVAPYSKIIAPRGTLVETDHGHHSGIAKASTTYVSTDLVYVHFHYRSYENIVRAARAKLEVAEPPVDVDDPVALAAYRGQGWHMIGYVLGGPESYYAGFRDLNGTVAFPDLTASLASLNMRLPFSEIELPTTVPEAHVPEVRVDEFSPSLVRGWALNPQDATTPVALRACVDGEDVLTVLCDGDRPDVKRSGFPSAAVGYSFRLPRAYFDGRNHSLQFKTAARKVALIISPDGNTEVYRFQDVWKPAIKSSVDGIHEGIIKGWVLRENDDETWVGGCFVHVTCDGSHVAHLRADRHRGDVGRAHAADADCGFEFIAPAAFRKARPQSFRFIVVPDGIEMSGSPLTTSFISDQNEAALNDLSETLDRMYVEMTQMRRKLRQMLPNPVYNLGSYDAWARQYQEDLAARMHTERPRSRLSRLQNKPLISVICPTFRPRLPDFTAAVESVIAQTYESWEIIIIDDGSNDGALTAQIEAYVKRDRRVRSIVAPSNVGISNATNLGLDNAVGSWIVFFDHDDILVPVALETMLTQALSSGAKLLYSDEDKIDGSGYFSEPAFKTDWNYRLLLGCNYICHLVMLDRDIQKQVGLINSRYDGAQDHDFLLRVSEALKPHEIHHVSEVLYHWRKSETSTASSTRAKQYAVEAGKAAVSDHLERRGLPAQVHSLNDSTWYKVQWLCSDEPSVTIIIPYKEQIDTTRHCVECILNNTRYKNFDVILIDNWSVSDEANRFSKEMNALPNIRVLRIEDDFNYSRLNNIAARHTEAACLILMNNDLFVSDAEWMRTLVNETLIDDAVGIVGGKFVYPNRMVQHAGVVLGVGGVAAHSHMGISENDPGYAARALFAQEMSAVTAACMLVRSDIFWKVGGLDEEHLTVAFNDVDLCLKVREAGYKVVWTPEFLAEHHESLSRGSDDIDPTKEARFFHEMQTMIERYGATLQNDPFYSPHFSLEMRPFYDLRNRPKHAASAARQREIVKYTAPPEQELNVAVTKNEIDVHHK